MPTPLFLHILFRGSASRLSRQPARNVHTTLPLIRQGSNYAELPLNLSARHKQPPPEEEGRLLLTQSGGELSGADGGGVHRVEEGASEVENRGEDEQQQELDPRHRGGRGGVVPKNRFLGVVFLFSSLSVTPPTPRRWRGEGAETFEEPEELFKNMKSGTRIAPQT